MKLSPSDPTPVSPEAKDPSSVLARQGVLYGLAAYSIWGSFPVFFKALAGATPLEIVCHRIFWSAVFLLIIVTSRRQLGNLWQVVQNRSILLTLCCSTLLIATNWLFFLFAIQREEVLQSSLGYFIAPLVSVLLGRVFLRERLSGWQRLSVVFALGGVLNLAFRQGQFPWIALVLATTFGLYGLLRKIARVEAMLGLTIETALLAPLSLGFLGYLFFLHQGAFGDSLQLDLLLPLSGVVTAIPLLLFVGAARRLRLATIGFLQYITPSLHFFLAIGLYNEPFARQQFNSFLLIWIGLAIYSWDSFQNNRSAHRGIPARGEA